MVFVDFEEQGRNQVRVRHRVSSVEDPTVAGGVIGRQDAGDGAKNGTGTFRGFAISG
ncbi:hypothetical protein EMIT0215P_60143 [Pseudomonas serboccidentalis]